MIFMKAVVNLSFPSSSNRFIEVVKITNMVFMALYGYTNNIFTSAFVPMNTRNTRSIIRLQSAITIILLVGY